MPELIKRNTNFYFTAWMLRPTRDPTNESFQIEKVIAKRKNKKTKRNELLVKYLYYDSSFNQWVDQKNIILGEAQ